MDLNFKNKFSKVEVPAAVRDSKSYIFEAVLLAVAAVLLYWFVAVPKAASLKNRQAQLEQVKAARKTMEDNVAALRNLSQELSQNSQNVERLDEALPLSERQIRTQALLESIIQSSGVVIGNLTVGAPSGAVVAGNPDLIKNPYRPKRALGTVAVTMSVSGSLSQLLDLLKKLESYGRIMELSSLDMSKVQNGTLNLGLTLNTYYFGPQ
jgi:Tfp pilus assembly protein PilO